MAPPRRANERSTFSSAVVVGVIVMIIVLFEPTNLDKLVFRRYGKLVDGKCFNKVDEIF